MQAQPHFSPKRIRVLLVNSNVIERSGLLALINNQTGLEVAGEASDYAEALEIATNEQPDVILLSYNISSNGILDSIPELLATASGARVLILTGTRDAEVHQRALLHGAMGLVLKDEPIETLIRAIHKIYAGEAWLDGPTMANVLAKLSRLNKQVNSDTASTEALTNREREILGLVCGGLKNKQIAAQLFISEATVRHHLTSIFSKLGVTDRMDLVRYAYRHSLIKP